MGKNETEVTQSSFDKINDLCHCVEDLLVTARKSAKKSVDTVMVYTYFEIGRMIVDVEQNGNNRAEYGKAVIKELSAYLTEKFGKGFSVTNIKQMRQFYNTYSNDKIGQTLSDQSEKLPVTSTGRRFYLSWSHYLVLMRMKGQDERHFYEIECVKNDAMVELTLPKDSNIFASKYELYLPDKKLLQDKIREWINEDTGGTL